MNIFIIANYTTLTGEIGNGRLDYLANVFVKQGHTVTLYTSTFVHRTKTQRKELEVKKLERDNFKIKLIQEPGYVKHIGLKRILSHRQYGINLQKALESLTNFPDVIYFSFPTFSSASIVSKFAKNNNIPSVIDIIDVWPEALRTVVKLPNFIFNFLVLPFTLKVNSIYKSVEAIVGVSETYVNRGRLVNKKAIVLPVFLGTDLDVFDSCEFKKIKPEGEIWLIYIGSLGYSYDIETVLKALILLFKQQKNVQIKLKILGSGPQKERLQKIAVMNNLPVEFVGFVKYPCMVNYLKNADIALSAIVNGAQQSITYKIGDYVSAGLPILNSSQNEELMNMIRTHELGYNYAAGNERDLLDKIFRLVNDYPKMKKNGKNSRKIAELKFNRKITNLQIVKLIENLVEKNV